MYATHPTKSKLIDTVVDMLDEMDVSELQVDAVLDRSGVSKGSMYHHFVDFAHLIEAAHVRRYSRMVDRSISWLAEVLASAKSRDEMRAGLQQVTRSTQSRELAALRFERARTIALSEHHPRMREAISDEQQRLTAAITDICREAQLKGWVRTDLDPGVLAVFIQAYTLGKLVDDVVNEQMDAVAWERLIDEIVDRVFLLTD